MVPQTFREIENRCRTTTGKVMASAIERSNILRISKETGVPAEEVKTVLLELWGTVNAVERKP